MVQAEVTFQLLLLVGFPFLVAMSLYHSVCLVVFALLVATARGMKALSLLLP